MKKLTLLAVIILLLSMSGCEGCGDEKTADNSQAQASAANSGRPYGAVKAQDFTLKDIFGKTIKLSNYLGKVVILDFWATHCPPCRAEIPFFVELIKQHEKDGLVILGAALDTVKNVKPFYKKYKMNYPVAICSQDIPALYGGIFGIPTTFVIDKDGYIVKKYVGYRPKQVFEEDFLKYK